MIIGIIGKARSGKDQFGEYLIDSLKEKYNRNFVRVAFADELKRMCEESFGLSKDQLWGDLKEAVDRRFRKPMVKETASGDDFFWSPREIMQAIGSFYRSIDYDFWVRALDKFIMSLPNNDFIITDVRHINECEYVKSKSGILIKVLRENADTIHGMAHESETSLDKYNGFDIEINNNGTLEELRTAAKDCASMIISTENLMNKRRIIDGG